MEHASPLSEKLARKRIKNIVQRKTDGSEWAYSDLGLAHRLAKLLIGRVYYRPDRTWLIWDFESREWTTVQRIPLGLVLLLEPLLTAEGAPSRIIESLGSHGRAYAVLRLFREMVFYA